MDVFDLVAKLTLDTSSYESELNGAESDTESFSSKLKGGLATATKGVATVIAGTTTAVTALGTAVTASAMKTAEYGDNIDKASQKLGISAKAYQEWDAVLQHSGTSIDSMGTAFKKLATASQDATDDQVEAFSKLGMSMDEVKNMSAEDLFGSVINGLQGMEEGTERTALATTLLGKGAMELGALLNTSADDTQAMIDQVNNLGGVMSDDAVKASARFQDSLQDMKTGFQGMGTSLTAELLPNLADLMDFVIDELPEIKAVVSTLLSDVIDGVGTAFDWVKSHFNQIKTVVTTVLTVISTVFGALWSACKVIFKAIGDAIADVTGKTKGAGVDWKAVATTIAQAITVAGTIIAGVIEMIGEIVGWLVEEVNTDGTAINLIWENMQTIISTVVTVIEAVIKTLIALLRGDFKGAFNEVKKIVETVFNSIKTISANGMNYANTVISNVLNSIKNKFVSVFDNVKNVVKKAIDAVKGMFNFSWSLPSIKLPHFKISGSFSLKPPSVPSIGVSWYAKAMNKASILDGATIFGSAGGSLLGGGETGREVISGESHLMDLIEQSVEGAFASRLDSISGMLAQYLPQMGSQKIVLDTGALVGQTVSAYDSALGKMYSNQKRYV